jgi:phosphate transport system protein
MKFAISIERIGDLLLGFSNRAIVAASRCEMEDIRDLTLMASRLEKMLAEVRESFEMRNLDRALVVLRSDAEIDRLRNLVFVRHLENPAGTHRSESFHVVFMTQALERAGDHVKNMAEEVCHLVSGHSVRHLLRSIDKPLEQMFLDQLRNKHAL